MRDAQQYLIGLDLGTSMIKGVLLGSDGRLISQEKAAMVYLPSSADRCEFDGQVFYRLVAELIRKLAAQAGDRTAIKGISMASASGNTFLADSDGQLLLPVISWLDNRDPAEIIALLSDFDADEVHATVGWPLLSQFPLAHLSWLAQHQPREFKAARHIGLSTDYLNYRLTGQWGIDASTATTFYLQDQASANWHQPYLDRLAIPAWKLPPILPSGTILGTLTARAAGETGLITGTPIVLGAFDHPCAARGTGVLAAGQTLLSCGTSWVSFLPAADRQAIVKARLLCDPYLRQVGLWGAMASLPAISQPIDRLIQRHISNDANRYRTFDELARLSPPGAHGLRIDPRLAVEKQAAADTKVSNFAPADIARAIMEGTALAVRGMIGQLADDGFPVAQLTMVGGAAEADPWPQIVADVLGRPLTIINGAHAGAIGAAMLAGIGTGLYHDEQDAWRQMNFNRRQLEPDWDACQVYAAMSPVPC